VSTQSIGQRIEPKIDLSYNFKASIREIEFFCLGVNPKITFTLLHISSFDTFVSSLSSEGGETVDYLNCLMPKDVNGFLKGLDLVSTP
jgi:hypothetical protein